MVAPKGGTMGSSETDLHTVTVSDGRVLEVAVTGSPEGPAVVFQHGSPGSAFLNPELDAAASERGLRLVAPSRAGYAGSTRDEGRDVAAVVDDLTRALDALGIVRFATVGWSGGGPHALACAALANERCAAALSLAGVAPYLPGEFDWTEGMAAENVEEFELARQAGEKYDEMLGAFREALLGLALPEQPKMSDLFGGLTIGVDDTVGADDVRVLLANLQRALAPGVGGWRDDDQAFLRPWGFDVAAIRVPVGIWYGSKDLMVPARHGEWLAANVNGAVARHFPDEGHLSLAYGRFGELLDAVVELAGGAW
jgi:pimeloyl-ACP methyl ester carboxylesterase